GSELDIEYVEHQSDENVDLLPSNGLPGIVRRLPSERPEDGMSTQLQVLQESVCDELVGVFAEEVLVGVELAVGDEDEGTGLEGFASDDGGGIHAAGGLG
ncbi:MAG: hypothetical protein Q9218_005057, partial [Villophora microphyllina]